jgi:hypothetical protein
MLDSGFADFVDSVFLLSVVSRFLRLNFVDTTPRKKRLRMLVVCMQMTQIRHCAIVNIWTFHFHTCFNNGLHKMPKLRVSS